MSRDYEPQAGQWYEDLDREETFRVMNVDPDDTLVRIQWLDGEIEDLDIEEWHTLDLELSAEPEGWVDDAAAEDDEAEDEDEDEDWDDEDDEDDDWDDDEDYDDEDDEYRDRE